MNQKCSPRTALVPESNGFGLSGKTQWLSTPASQCMTVPEIRRQQTGLLCGRLIERK